MTIPLHPSVREAMKGRAEKIREEQARGANAQFVRMWQLQGKNAIVQPGGSIFVRLMPRWDRYLLKDGKLVADPAAQAKTIYVPALEHWWDNGQRRCRDWCPAMFAGDRCPIDEAVAELSTSASPEDRQLAHDLRASEIALFNVAVGPLGKRLVGEDGLVDIRPLAASGTIFLAISNYMTGGDGGEQFSRGDVSDPREGFDLILYRPASKGDRWKVDIAGSPGPMFSPDEQAHWVRWWERIRNLDEVLEKETKPYAVLYKEFHGMEPDGGVPAAAVGSRGTAEMADFPGEEPGKNPGEVGQQLVLDGLGGEFPMLEPQASAATAPAASPAPTRSGAAPGRARSRTR